MHCIHADLSSDYQYILCSVPSCVYGLPYLVISETHTPFLLWKINLIACCPSGLPDLKIFSTSTIPVHLQERMEATQQPETATPGTTPLLVKQNKGNKDLGWNFSA